jgi:hypothetical protein
LQRVSETIKYLLDVFISFLLSLFCSLIYNLFFRHLADLVHNLLERDSQKCCLTTFTIHPLNILSLWYLPSQTLSSPHDFSFKTCNSAKFRIFSYLEMFKAFVQTSKANLRSRLFYCIWSPSSLFSSIQSKKPYFSCPKRKSSDHATNWRFHHPFISDYIEVKSIKSTFSLRLLAIRVIEALQTRTWEPSSNWHVPNNQNINPNRVLNIIWD